MHSLQSPTPECSRPSPSRDSPTNDLNHPQTSSPHERLAPVLPSPKCSRASPIRYSPVNDLNDPQTSSSHERSAPRIRKLPARYRDQLPEPPVSTHDPPAPLSIVRRVFLHVFDSFRTRFNRFGIAREYRHRPTHDPDSIVTSDDLSNSNPHSSNQPDPQQEEAYPPWPWANMSIWRLMTWALTGRCQKSAREVT